MRKEIIAAIEAGNFDEVKEITENAVNIDELLNPPRIWTGFAPLQVAAKLDHYEIANFLLEKGASVNNTSLEEVSPLHFAAISGNNRMLELILENGGEINGADHQGNSPVHYAAASGNSEAMKILVSSLSKQEDITNMLTQKNNSHLTALHVAVAKNDQAMASFIITAGKIDLKTLDSEVTPQRPRLPSTLTGIGREIYSLYDSLPYEKTELTDCRESPLHLAVKLGHREMAAFLLENGASPILKNEIGKTASDYAWQRGKDEMKKLFPAPSAVKPPARSCYSDHVATLVASTIRGLGAFRGTAEGFGAAAATPPALTPPSRRSSSAAKKDSKER